MAPKKTFFWPDSESTTDRVEPKVEWRTTWRMDSRTWPDFFDFELFSEILTTFEVSLDFSTFEVSLDFWTLLELPILTGSNPWMWMCLEWAEFCFSWQTLNHLPEKKYNQLKSCLLRNCSKTCWLKILLFHISTRFVQ